MATNEEKMKAAQALLAKNQKKSKKERMPFKAPKMKVPGHAGWKIDTGSAAKSTRPTPKPASNVAPKAPAPKSAKPKKTTYGVGKAGISTVVDLGKNPTQAKYAEGKTLLGKQRKAQGAAPFKATAPIAKAPKGPSVQEVMKSNMPKAPKFEVPNIQATMRKHTKPATKPTYMMKDTRAPAAPKTTKVKIPPIAEKAIGAAIGVTAVLGALKIGGEAGKAVASKTGKDPQRKRSKAPKAEPKPRTRKTGKLPTLEGIEVYPKGTTPPPWKEIHPETSAPGAVEAAKEQIDKTRKVKAPPVKIFETTKPAHQQPKAAFEAVERADKRAAKKSKFEPPPLPEVEAPKVEVPKPRSIPVGASAKEVAAIEIAASKQAVGQKPAAPKTPAAPKVPAAPRPERRTQDLNIPDPKGKRSTDKPIPVPEGTPPAQQLKPPKAPKAPKAPAAPVTSAADNQKIYQDARAAQKAGDVKGMEAALKVLPKGTKKSAKLAVTLKAGIESAKAKPAGVVTTVVKKVQTRKRARAAGKQAGKVEKETKKQARITAEGGEAAEVRASEQAKLTPPKVEAPKVPAAPKVPKAPKAAPGPSTTVVEQAETQIEKAAAAVSSEGNKAIYVTARKALKSGNVADMKAALPTLPAGTKKSATIRASLEAGIASGGTQPPVAPATEAPAKKQPTGRTKSQERKIKEEERAQKKDQKKANAAKDKLPHEVRQGIQAEPLDADPAREADAENKRAEEAKKTRASDLDIAKAQPGYQEGAGQTRREKPLTSVQVEGEAAVKAKTTKVEPGKAAGSESADWQRGRSAAPEAPLAEGTAQTRPNSDFELKLELPGGKKVPVKVSTPSPAIAEQVKTAGEGLRLAEARAAGKPIDLLGRESSMSDAAQERRLLALEAGGKLAGTTTDPAVADENQKVVTEARQEQREGGDRRKAPRRTPIERVQAEVAKMGQDLLGSVREDRKAERRETPERREAEVRKVAQEVAPRIQSGSEGARAVEAQADKILEDAGYRKMHDPLTETEAEERVRTRTELLEETRRVAIEASEAVEMGPKQVESRAAIEKQQAERARSLPKTPVGGADFVPARVGVNQGLGYVYRPHTDEQAKQARTASRAHARARGVAEGQRYGTGNVPDLTKQGAGERASLLNAPEGRPGHVPQPTRTDRRKGEFGKQIDTTTVEGQEASQRKFAERNVAPTTKPLTSPAIRGSEAKTPAAKYKGMGGKLVRGGAWATAIFAALGAAEAGAAQLHKGWGEATKAGGKRFTSEFPEVAKGIAQFTGMDLAASFAVPKGVSAVAKGLGMSARGAALTGAAARFAARGGLAYIIGRESLPFAKEQAEKLGSAVGEWQFDKGEAAREKKGSEEKYGTVEAATKTRKAREAYKRRLALEAKKEKT